MRGLAVTSNSLTSKHAAQSKTAQKIVAGEAEDSPSLVQAGSGESGRRYAGKARPLSRQQWLLFTPRETPDMQADFWPVAAGKGCRLEVANSDPANCSLQMLRSRQRLCCQLSRPAEPFTVEKPRDANLSASR